MKRREIDMLQGPLLPEIIRYTVPVILCSVLQLLFNAADLIVVGQFCGSISVGAVSATSALTNLIINLFIGLSIGAGVAVAHSIGSHIDEETGRTVHTSMALSLVGGIFLTLFGVFFSEPLLRLMRAPENVVQLAAVYMEVYFGGITFTIFYNFASAILRAAGDTRSPLIYLTWAGVINVVLNLIFVIFFHMNVAGVALATVISQAVSAILVVRALIRRTDACHLDLKKIRFHRQALEKIVRIGLPAGIQGALFSISNVIIQSAINAFDSGILIAANGAVGNLTGFIYQSLNGFYQSAVNFTGQNAGAHRFDRVKKIFWICQGCVLVLGLVGANAILLAAEPLLSIYIPDSPEALEAGVTILATTCPLYFFSGTMDVSTGSLRGLGCSFSPMVISVLGICGFRILWIYTVFQVPIYHTVRCLFLSYPLSWAITFLVQSVLFLFFLHRRQKQACSPV